MKHTVARSPTNPTILRDYYVFGTKKLTELGQIQSCKFSHSLFDQVLFRSSVVSIKCRFDQASFRSNVVLIKLRFDQVSFDQVSFDQLSFDQLSFDKVSFDQVSFDQVSFDHLSGHGWLFLIE